MSPLLCYLTCLVVCMLYDYKVCFISGWALVAEGFLSAIYHVCPNDTNFQFGMSMYASVCVCHAYMNVVRVSI